MTRPDLHPPKLRISTPARGTGPGRILMGPMVPRPEQAENVPQPGRLIADDRGEPVWFAPDPPGTVSMDLKVQQYRGEPVLTWWNGEMIAPPGYGKGQWYIADRSYRTIATVRTGAGLHADMHDLVITPQDTALLMSYHEVRADLGPIGGPPDGAVLEGVIQEVDIATGAVLFEWHSLDHVGVEEALEAPPPDPNQPWDYFHVNSVEPEADGTLLISARNTHAVYKIRKDTGAVVWRLSGKFTDFRMGPGTLFEWQHDARRRPDGTISIFDNGEAATGEDRSRGLVLRVDEAARTADLVREDRRPEATLSPNMANYQLLDNGHAFAGWGGADGFTEFGPDGSVRLDGKLPEDMASYRTFRMPWTGEPADAPAVTARPGPERTTVVHTSWNGATEVAAWRVLTGPDPRTLRPAREAARAGFETRIEVPDRVGHVAVEGLDGTGRVLGTSPVVPVSEAG
ncbi:arylsulfotransferase family protein [Saccharopolyspora sp. CA-218241]|uniref:arylsulfotransferase family protein n=1 Tax=Saccharopolyspora sp. CA-218241 TaxID=3240027 RepID=UPI003D954C16